MEFVYFLILGIVVIIILLLKFFPKSNNQIVQEEKQPAKKLINIETLIPISVYFGSQQGTAARFAKQLSEEGREHGFITNEIDLNDANFNEEMTQGKVGIFCMATHGEGDPTDNAKKFITWLEQEQQSMSQFRFCVFGLGNRQYEHYNKIGKYTNQLCEKQGAIRCYKYGEGDANSTLEDDFIEWKESLWTELKISLKDLIEQSKYQSQTNIEKIISLNLMKHIGTTFSLIQTNEQEIQFDQCQGQFDFQTKQLLKAKDCEVSQITQLRQNTQDGSTLHIIFETGKVGIDYKTAMNLGVFPENDIESINQLSQLLGENLNTIYKLELLQQNAKTKLPFPSPISVENILKKFLDYSGQIMKNTLIKLVKYVQDDEIKQKLLHLTTNEGKNEFQQLLNNKITIVDLIKEYKIKLNLAQFIDLCPRISPRLFTIASSNLKNPQQIEIADSLLIDELQNGQQKYGLCSKYFLQIQQQLEQGLKPKVRIDFRESSFKLPENPSQSLIMIGPGTGIAPFRAFLQEREIFLQNQQQKQNNYILYFGCKHQDGDFIFKDEILKYKEQNILDQLNLAFSRDQENKIYVQNHIQQHQEELYNFIKDDKAIIYICGSTQMGNSVQGLLKQMIEKYSQLSNEEAEKIIQEMEKSKKLIKELW